MSKDFNEIDEQDAINSQIETVSINYLDKIIKGDIVWINGVSNSMDDFIADMDIDSTLFGSFLSSGDDSFKDSANEKLYTWCENLVKEALK